MHRINRRALCALTAAALLASPFAAAAVVPGAIILKEGDDLGGSLVSSLNAPFTDGNGNVGFVAALEDNRRAIWYDSGPVFFSDDALPDVLTGGEGTMGVSDTGQFIYSPSFNGSDAVYTSAGLLLAEDQAAPGFPGQFSSFNSRPQMLPDGTAHWIGGITDEVGGSTDSRVLYRATDISDPGSISAVLKDGDSIGAFTIDSIQFGYMFSDDGTNAINEVRLNTGSSGDDNAITVNGSLIAQENRPTGQGDNWDNFDNVSINNAGTYLFSGDTDGDSSLDEFIAINGSIQLRQGDTVDGLMLGSGNDAADINDLDQVAFLWDLDVGEALFFGQAASLSDSVALLETGDELDIDGDGIGDWIINDFNASNGIGPGLDLAEDGWVYVEVDVERLAGGDEFEAVIRVAIPEPGALSLLALGVLALVRRR